jgi:hypothetical protein
MNDDRDLRVYALRVSANALHRELTQVIENASNGTISVWHARRRLTHDLAVIFGQVAALAAAASKLKAATPIMAPRRKEANDHADQKEARHRP